MGNAIPTDVRDAYLSRAAAMCIGGGQGIAVVFERV